MFFPHLFFVIVLIISCPFLILPLTAQEAAQQMHTPRNPTWAQPVNGMIAPNLHQVTPSIYRSAQPSTLDMKKLEAFGIRQVLNLRYFHTDTDELKGTSLIALSVPMNAWHINTKEVIAALRYLKNPDNGPLLVHCQHGADRTGLVIAMYRIVEEKWSKEDAIEEMVKGNFGYHTVWKNIIDFIKKANIEEIRAELAQPT